MDCSVIPRILEELNLDEKDVTNIYHYGSWVYGTNSPTSDRDLLIVTHSSDRNSLKFWTDFDYFHDFKCHKLWGQYDITVYTVENFEMLLEKSYLIAVQCVYLPDEFKLKNEIDYRRIYLEKYFNPLRIKQAAFYEMYRDWKLYKPENNSNGPSEKQLSWRNYVFKHFFHGLRYLDFVEQLIQTQSIYNYKRVTCIFDEMKDIRGDPTDNSGMKRVAEFVLRKSAEFKSRLDALVPTNTIKGTFEAHITLDCTEQAIEKLKTACENTHFIHSDNDKSLQLVISSSYHGEYPSIVKQIEEEVYQHFADFQIRRIQIESLVSNEGVPRTYIDKKLFWNKTNYFQFHYSVPLEKDRHGEKFKKLINTCQSKYRLNLDLSRHRFKQIDGNNLQYISIVCFLNVGQEKAFEINDEIIKYSAEHNFPSTTIKHAFVVYDRCIDANND